MIVSDRLKTQFLFVALLAAPASAQEWVRFRGPNGTGISEARGVPVQWTEKDFAWRIKFDGENHSQPVIWGDKIFLTTARDNGVTRMLVCLSKADGKTLWSKECPFATHKIHKFNSFASGSPAVEKDRVVAGFADKGKYLVKAWDHEGKELWSADLGAFTSQHGQGSSPMFFENKVIVCNDQDGASFITALDAKSGKPVWKSTRRAQEQGTAYSTPCVFQRGNGKPELLLTSQAHGISSIDPRTGAANWEAVVFDKRSVASPVVAGDLALGSCGSGGGGIFLVAVRLGGRGDVTSSHVAYKITKGASYVTTPLVVGERIYIMSDDGFASCFEAATGRTVWQERVSKGFFGSPVLIDGKIYANSKEGETIVLEAADTYKLVARNPLGEASYSTPCVDGSRLYLKTFTHLVCVGGK